MDILAQVNMTDRDLPVRAYLHANGAEVYAPHAGKGPQIRGLRKHIEETMHPNLIPRRAPTQKEQSLLIAIVIASGTKKEEKILDCFAIYGDKNSPHWGRNSNIVSWRMLDASYVAESAFQREICCGDGMIILGQEEAYRRRCRTLDQYLKKPPEIITTKRTF